MTDVAPRLEPRRLAAVVASLGLFALLWTRLPDPGGAVLPLSRGPEGAAPCLDIAPGQPRTLYGNTTLRLRVDVLETGAFGLELVARSTRARGRRARLVIRVDRRVVGEIHVARPGVSGYWLPLELGPGLRSVEIAFDNDTSAFPEDLDLIVHSMRLVEVGALDAARLPLLAPGAVLPAERLSLGRGTLVDAPRRTVLAGGFAGEAFVLAGEGAVLVDAHAAPTPEGWRASEAGAADLGGRACELLASPAAGVTRFRCDAAPGPNLLRVHATAEAGALALSHLSLQGPGATDALPAPAPEALAVPARLSPARDGEASYGAPAGEGWMFFRNGAWSARVLVEHAGRHTIRFLGGGTTAGGRGPAVYLIVDGRQRAFFDVLGDPPRLYAAQVELSEGVHELSFAFANDVFTGTEDRNLWLGPVELLR